MNNFKVPGRALKRSANSSQGSKMISPTLSHSLADKITECSSSKFIFRNIIVLQGFKGK